MTIVWSLFRPTHVYVSHPALYDVLPRRSTVRQTLVYDCMDDAVAMAPAERRPALLERERMLLRRAHRVVVSSGVLATRLRARYGPLVESKLRFVPNGIDARRGMAPQRPAQMGHVGEPVVGYAGTVGEWFDFGTVLAALGRCPAISLQVIGPRSGREPHHDRIQYHVPVDHEALPSMLSQCDALIMPFTVDDVVAAVNPVKLYEYLQYGVPVIVRRYEEIEQEFGMFVHFYESSQDLSLLFERLQEGCLPARAEAKTVAAFLETASWTRRWAAITGQATSV